MLVIAFIGVFILGAIVGVIGCVFASKHITNMSLKEMSYVGGMIIEAGNNRESAIYLEKDSKVVDGCVFEEK